MSRLLGVDLGERRIGVAVTGPAGEAAHPLVTLRRGSLAADAIAIARLAAEQRAAEIVVGLPLEMDGSVGPEAEAARAWGEAIARTTGIAVCFRDERLTSEAAEARLGGPRRGRSGGPPTPAQRTARRARVDREAAALILEAELDARRLSAR